MSKPVSHPARLPPAITLATLALGATVLGVSASENSDWRTREQLLLAASGLAALGLAIWALRAAWSKRFGTAIVAGAAAAVTLAIARDMRIQVNGFLDIFLFPLIVLTGLAFSAVALSKILAGTFWALAKGDGRSRLAVALVGALPLFVWVWGREVNDQYCRDARRWCEERVLEIEVWKTRHDVYPRTLDEARVVRDLLPRRLRREVLYGSDDTGYMIGYVSDLPGDWAEVWIAGPNAAFWRSWQLGL